jgi:hypothetical protein
MSTTQAAISQTRAEAQTAPAVAPTATLASDEATPTADGARAPLRAPENAQAATAPEVLNEGSIAPKERPPVIKPETAENATHSIPTDLTAITSAIEANAAQQAGQLIAQANAQGANLPTHGLAITVKIDSTPITGAATTPEAHACVGASCSHCASPAKVEAATAQASAQTMTPAVVENTAAPVTEVAATQASPQAAAPMVEQPAVSEAKPEGLTMAASVPAKTIETPAANAATLAPQPQLVNGANR